MTETKDLYLKYDCIHTKFPPDPDTEEWEAWYFDAALDNGDHLVVMYYVNDTRSFPRQPAVRTNIYEANGNEISKISKYKISDVSFSSDKCDVKMGEEYCRDAGGYWEIYTNIDGNGARLKFTPQTPYWCVGKDEEEMARTPMGWTVSCARATVEGVLIKNGKEFPVKGIGYHDHNWALFRIGVLFNNWYWGKVHTDDISIDYSIVIPKQGDPMPTILALDAKNVIFDPLADPTRSCELHDLKTDPVMGLAFAQNLKLKGSSNGVDIDLDIKLDRIVWREQPEDIKELKAHAESALRYIGHEILKVTKNGVEKVYNTESLHEVVWMPVEAPT